MIKLVGNTSNDSLFGFFMGSDDPLAWTEKSPAVWHSVRRLDESSETPVHYAPLSFGNPHERKWIFVKFAANSKSVVSELNGYGLVADMLDGLSRKPLAEGIRIHGSYGDPLGEFAYDRLLLLSLRPSDGSHAGVPMRLSFSENAIEFDFNSRYYRDWRNRITGNSWNTSGKLIAFRSLSQCGRNRNSPPLESEGMP